MSMCVIGIHQGGRIYGWTVSIVDAEYSGKVLLRCSSGEMKVLLWNADALVRIRLAGWSSGSVAIRVYTCGVLLRSRIWGGMRPDSISRADVAVVRKAPNIAFVAVRGADSSLDV